MQQVEITAEVRTCTGSAASRRLRRRGMVPAVLYGHETEGIPLVLDGRRMDHLIGAEGFTGLIDLKVEGEAKSLPKDEQLLVLVKGHQADPITRRLSHIDLYRVSLEEEVAVTIPIRITGVAPGVKVGGILDIIRRELEVRCLPNNIPEFIAADVSQLELGDSIHVKDLKIPKGVSLHIETNYTIVTVTSPTKMEVPIPEEEVAVEAVEEEEAKPEEAEVPEKKEE